MGLKLSRAAPLCPPSVLVSNRHQGGLPQLRTRLVCRIPRGLGLQGSGPKNAGLQGSRTKISGLQGSITFPLGLRAPLGSTNLKLRIRVFFRTLVVRATPPTSICLMQGSAGISLVSPRGLTCPSCVSSKSGDVIGD